MSVKQDFSVDSLKKYNLHLFFTLKINDYTKIYSYTEI